MTLFDDAKKISMDDVGKVDKVMAAMALSGPKQTPEVLAKLLGLYASSQWVSPAMGAENVPLPTHYMSGLPFLKALQARAEELGIGGAFEQAWKIYAEWWAQGVEARDFEKVVGDWQTRARHQGQPSGGLHQGHFVLFIPPGLFNPETIMKEARKLVLEPDNETAEDVTNGSPER